MSAPDNPPFNELTPAEAERLALLIEECAEVQQIACKILRHGYDSIHPQDVSETDNRALLQNEIGDFLAVLDLMQADKTRDIHASEIQGAKKAKAKRMIQYLHHQP